MNSMSQKRNTSGSQGRNDQEIVNLFLEKAREIAATTLGRTGFSVNHHISYDQISGIATELEQPDEDAVRSFLVTFRHFVSESEPIFLGRVYNICYRYLENEVLKNRIKETREHWTRVHEQNNGTRLVIYGTDLSGVKIFHVWANGRYFHNDADYKRILDQADPLTLQMLRAQFLTFIISIMNLVQDLYQVILHRFVEDPAKPGFILLSPA
jgi:hypothetical protein